MAIKGRNELEQVIGTNLPTNNSRQISAENLRDVVKDLNISKYNIKDDELRQLTYEGNQTLEEKLAGLFREVIKRGSFSGYDIAAAGIGGAFNNTDGIVKTATVSGQNGPDDKIRVVFSESIENKVIIPVIYYEGQDWNASNDLSFPVIQYISSTELDIAFRELAGNVQNLKVEFIII